MVVSNIFQYTSLVRRRLILGLRGFLISCYIDGRAILVLRVIYTIGLNSPLFFGIRHLDGRSILICELSTRLKLVVVSLRFH